MVLFLFIIGNSIGFPYIVVGVSSSNGLGFERGSLLVASRGFQVGDTVVVLGLRGYRSFLFLNITRYAYTYDIGLVKEITKVGNGNGVSYQVLSLDDGNGRRSTFIYRNNNKYIEVYRIIYVIPPHISYLILLYLVITPLVLGYLYRRDWYYSSLSILFFVMVLFYTIHGLYYYPGIYRETLGLMPLVYVRNAYTTSDYDIVVEHTLRDTSLLSVEKVELVIPATGSTYTASGYISGNKLIITNIPVEAWIELYENSKYHLTYILVKSTISIHGGVLEESFNAPVAWKQPYIKIVNGKLVVVNENPIPLDLNTRIQIIDGKYREIYRSMRVEPFSELVLEDVDIAGSKLVYVYIYYPRGPWDKSIYQVIPSD